MRVAHQLSLVFCPCACFFFVWTVVFFSFRVPLFVHFRRQCQCVAPSSVRPKKFCDELSAWHAWDVSVRRRSVRMPVLRNGAHGGPLRCAARTQRCAPSEVRVDVSRTKHGVMQRRSVAMRALPYGAHAHRRRRRARTYGRAHTVLGFRVRVMAVKMA